VVRKSDSAPVLSIVIATHNRAEILHEALDSLARQSGSVNGLSVEDQFEIIVADNRSADSTPIVVDRWRREMAHLRYVNEPRLGVSYARNRGIEEARGEFVAFLDDECTVSETFVADLVSHLQDHQPSLFGGPVFPRYLALPPKPKWFRDAYGSFSVFEEGTDRRDMWLSGANMGGKRSALSAVGGFSPDLGPRGRRMVYMEEQDLLERVVARFGIDSVHYFRNVPVWHLVRPEKYRLRSFFYEQYNRGYWRGRFLEHSAQGDVTVVNTKNNKLFMEILRTPFMRNRDAYPYIQNYIIEVVLPFVRTCGVASGWMVQTTLRLLPGGNPTSTKSRHD
jgi:glycosyltransferase involved in cell wall biosynthesis